MTEHELVTVRTVVGITPELTDMLATLPLPAVNYIVNRLIEGASDNGCHLTEFERLGVRLPRTPDFEACKIEWTFPKSRRNAVRNMILSSPITMGGYLEL